MLYFLQKNVSRRSRVGTLDVSKNWKEHKKFLTKYEALGRVFEFGAGKNLGQNIYLSEILEGQIVVDLNPMIDLELVDKARQRLSKEVKLRSRKEIKTIEDLKSYGITYLAPYDAAKTDLADQSIDACISTDTLEHIPESSLFEIFSELRRTLKDQGIVSAKIDYSDHYAHTDNSISLLNYLKFDNSTWKKFNHDCHYQNRLRHYDYLRIFNETGFHVVEEKLCYAEKNIPSEIAEIYKDRSAAWKATSAHIVLMKNI